MVRKGVYAGKIIRKVTLNSDQLKKQKGAKGSIQSAVISGLASQIDDPTIRRKLLQKLGRELVKSIKYEGKKDMAMATSVRGKPVPNGGGLGNSFFNTVKYQIIGSSTIEIISDWEWLELVLNGMPKTKMIKLVAQRNPNLWKRTSSGKLVRKAIPLKGKNGTINFRLPPLTIDKVWVHPGVSKHTFWQKGIDKWRAKAPKIIEDFLKKQKKGKK